ncbi:response regulator [Leptolyngbya cf. ectocarpi LEGE 11479]|uniref:Response regulator n=1 Tax=Leptolyngbya cf. ectocarpi LEGE 11479 TaxID=1828722 RepID=A0A928X0K9_LEPEC|nr:response regulator [Leptolyngbya ectocarpi]MBE9066804.1 response regulator [Leptolyngbya cf. ectocarpi LEGE 11479]
MPRILLIEKNELSCRILEQQLKRKGYDVITSTEGGDQGIVLAITASPDLILVGTELPMINGWQVARILKESTVTQKIPVIILTTPISLTELAMLSDSHYDGYSLKPINIKSLLGKIEALLKGLSVAIDVDTDTQDRSVSQQSHVQKEELRNVNSATPLQRKTLNIDISTYKSCQKQVSAGPMIFYIDNNLVDSHAVAKISQDAGYTYASYTDSFQALPLLVKFQPRLILLSARMPVVDGYELCTRVRRISDIENTPVIIMSNNDSVVDRMRAKAAGASTLLKKPIQEARVLRVLQQYLQPIEVGRTIKYNQQYQYGF